MAENLETPSFGNFSIENTMEVGPGGAELLNDLLSPETSTSNPDQLQEIVKEATPLTPDVKPDVPKRKEIVPKAEGEELTGQDLISSFLGDNGTEEETTEDVDPQPVKKKAPAAEAKPTEEPTQETEEGEEEQTSQFTADPETVRESNRKWKAYSPAKKQAILAEGKAIYTDMIAAMPKGAGSPEVQAIIERWRKHMDYFWTPNLDQLQGIANGYNDDPRFKANFDKMHPELAGFMREAVKVYVANQKK